MKCEDALPSRGVCRISFLLLKLFLVFYTEPHPNRQFNTPTRALFKQTSGANGQLQHSKSPGAFVQGGVCVKKSAVAVRSTRE